MAKRDETALAWRTCAAVCGSSRSITLTLKVGTKKFTTKTRIFFQYRALFVVEAITLTCQAMRDALSAFKLEAAKSYASISDLKELELRLVAHLLRIESKLDKTAMKTEALRAGKRDEQ